MRVGAGGSGKSSAGLRFRAAILGAVATLAIPPATVQIVETLGLARACPPGESGCRAVGLIGYYAGLIGGEDGARPNALALR